MVRFVDVQNMIRWVTDRGVGPITSGMVTALERAIDALGRQEGID